MMVHLKTPTLELTTTWTNTLSYDTKFGEHKINAVIGTELIRNQINNSVKRQLEIIYYFLAIQNMHI